MAYNPANPNGATTSANSTPVVIASDQSAIPVAQLITTASGTITTQNLAPAGVATASSSVEITLANSGTLVIQTTGTYTGALSLQVTVDNSTWITIGGTPFINVSTGGYLASITSALQSIFQCESTGFIKARISALAAVTGTATISLRGIQGVSMVALDTAIPAGGNIIGFVGSSGTFTVGGTTAQNTAATGNPVNIAGVVGTTTSTPTTAGNIGRLIVTTGGQLQTKPYGLPETDWSFAGVTGGIINTTDVVVKVAGAAGIRNYVTGMDISNASATVATEVVIKDGATTVLWRGKLASNAPTIELTFPTPLKGTAATAINVACIATGAAIYFNAQGYQSN